MTEDEIARTAREAHELARALAERVEDLENEREVIKKLPTAVAELHGAVDVLRDLVIGKLDNVKEGVDTLAGLETTLKYAAMILVPVLVALVGGYFALRAANIQHVPTPTPIVRTTP